MHLTTGHYKVDVTWNMSRDVTASVIVHVYIILGQFYFNATFYKRASFVLWFLVALDFSEQPSFLVLRFLRLITLIKTTVVLYLNYIC